MYREVQLMAPLFPSAAAQVVPTVLLSSGAGVVSGRLRIDLQQPRESVSTACRIEVPLQSWMNDRPQYLHQLPYLDSVCLSTKSLLLHYPRKGIWKFPMLGQSQLRRDVGLETFSIASQRTPGTHFLFSPLFPKALPSARLY